MKCATKPIRHYPPHLTNVATLLWEIKKSNFLQIFSTYRKMQTNCIFIPLTLLFIHKFWNFRCLDSEFSPYWLQIKFSVPLCYFTCLLLRSVHDTGNSSHKTSLQCLSTINITFGDKDKILIKTHKYAQHTVSSVDELKSVHWNCSLFAFFHMCWIFAEKLNFWYPKVV